MGIILERNGKTMVKDKLDVNVEEVQDRLDIDPVTEDDIPDTDEAGPAILGRTPVVGMLRRKNDEPVVRDKIKDELDL